MLCDLSCYASFWDLHSAVSQSRACHERERESLLAPSFLHPHPAPPHSLSFAQRGEPLTRQQWQSFAREDGRVLEESKLRSLVFRGKSHCLLQLPLTRTDIHCQPGHPLVPASILHTTTLFNMQQAASSPTCVAKSGSFSSDTTRSTRRYGEPLATHPLVVFLVERLHLSAHHRDLPVPTERGKCCSVRGEPNTLR